jgi:hypothetical protein
MSDIFSVDSAKWKVRIAMHFLEKELTKIAEEHGMYIPKGKSVMDMVHDDLRTCPNRGVKKIYKKIIEAGSHMKEHYQTATIIDLVPFALWVSYHDTAYRDPMFWVMNDIINDPEFKNDIKEYVKPPSEWYCPTWHDVKKNSKELQASGELTKFQLSPDEMIFVPEQTEAMKSELLKLQREMQKQLRLKDRSEL